MLIGVTLHLHRQLGTANIHPVCLHSLLVC